MEPKTENNFKAVEFMRKVRNELSDLYRNDKERFHKELKKTMDDFLSARNKASANTANSGI
jgi:mRNA-degrading endonuclease RelE of RelBE toxin-antitoxin system